MAQTLLKNLSYAQSDSLIQCTQEPTNQRTEVEIPHTYLQTLSCPAIFLTFSGPLMFITEETEMSQQFQIKEV